LPFGHAAGTLLKMELGPKWFVAPTAQVLTHRAGEMSFIWAGKSQL